MTFPGKFDEGHGGCYPESTTPSRIGRRYRRDEIPLKPRRFLPSPQTLAWTLFFLELFRSSVQGASETATLSTVLTFEVPPSPFSNAVIVFLLGVVFILAGIILSSLRNLSEEAVQSLDDPGRRRIEAYLSGKKPPK